MSSTSSVPQRFTSKVDPLNSPRAIPSITCPQLASLLEQCRRTGQRLGLKPKHGFIPSARLARTGYQQAYLPKENEAHTSIASLHQDKESLLAKKLLLRSVTVDRACYIAAVMIEGDITQLLGPTLKDLKMARVEDFLRNSLGIENSTFNNSELKELRDLENEDKSVEECFADMDETELEVIQVVDNENWSMIVHPATSCKEREEGMDQELSGCGVGEHSVNVQTNEEKGFDNECVRKDKVGDQEDFDKCSEPDECCRKERCLLLQEIQTREAFGKKCGIDQEGGFADRSVENLDMHLGSGTGVGEVTVNIPDVMDENVKEQIIETEIVSPSLINVNRERVIEQITSNISREDATKDRKGALIDQFMEDYFPEQAEISKEDDNAEEALVFLVTPRPEDSLSSLREAVVSDFSWFDCSSVSVTQVVGRLEVRVMGDRELGLALLAGLEAKYWIGLKPEVDSCCCIILYLYSPYPSYVLILPLVSISFPSLTPSRRGTRRHWSTSPSIARMERGRG